MINYKYPNAIIALGNAFNQKEVNKMKLQPLHTENELPLILPAKTVAKVLGISLPFCYELFRSDDFPAFRISTRWVVTRDALFEWLDKQSHRNKSDFIRKV